MKRVLLSFINIGIVTILMHSNVNAQFALNNSVNVKHHSRTEKYDYHNPGVSSGSNIDFRTLKDFKKRFTLINNAAWEITNKGSFAEFTADSIKTTVAYGNNGKWSYTI